MQEKVFTQVNIKGKAVQNAYSTLIGNIHLLSIEKEIKTIAITSCNQKEGKTILATDLAISIASMGKKTLLVDLDLRKTYSAKKLEQTANTFGIYQYLTENIELSDALCKTNIDNLFFLSSGKISGNPLSIICSEKLKLFIDNSRKIYDCIIFDTSYLEGLTDAVIISAKVDAAILVAKKGYTSIIDLKKAQEQLNRAGVNILGVVLNKGVRKTAKSKRKENTKVDSFSKQERVNLVT